MFTLKRLDQPLWEARVKGRLFFFSKNFKQPEDQAVLDHLAQTLYPSIREVLSDAQFEGKRGQMLTLPLPHEGHITHVIFLGLGCLTKSWDNEREHARRAIARAVPQLKRFNITQSTVSLPAYLAKATDQSIEGLALHLGIACNMAAYEFDSFKTEDKKEPFQGTLLVDAPQADSQELDRLLNQATIIATAINNARQWADTPANIMTATVLAAEAQAVANKHGNLKCTIFGKERAQELGMGSYLSVDQGSAQDGKFVILEYKSNHPDAATIAICGKGIMFDTGGISLKPSSSMDGMKFDMSGAAATIATLDIIAQLNPSVNVVGIAPLAENMPSGSASRQDDIVTAMNGKTIEIKNTDAEGRLVLADALCYAEKFYQPDIIIDIATLTGACAYALGHFYTAIVTKDRQLAETFIEIGKKTGDRIWELPLDDDFMEANKSDVADLSNSGSRAYLAGTIIGACFLSKFVEKARWAHLDIAGTAHDVTGVNYVGKGATGAGIRALVKFIMSYDSAEKTGCSKKTSCS